MIETARPLVGRPGAPPRRYLILAICCASLFIVGLDNTIIFVALPSIKRELQASVAQLQWVIDAYTLVIASLLMLAGSTADRVGRARVFKLGLAVFTAGSLMCSIAPNVQLLIAFRSLQAVGGSMLNPVALSIVRNTFTDPRERAMAIGVWSSTVGLSLALGPVLGGALVDAVSWRAMFWINVPVGIAAAVLAQRYVPESRARHARRLDPIGQVLMFAALASAIFAFIRAPDAGWTANATLGLFTVALAALGALIAYELRRREPLIELRFFRSAPFSGAVVIALAAFAGVGGLLFLSTTYLQTARHYSAFHAGLYMLPLAAGNLLTGPQNRRLVERFGTRPSLTLGGTLMVISGIILTGLSTMTETPLLMLSYLLFGLGLGLVNPPITQTAVSGMPAAQAGVAAAVASSSRQVGQALGVAVVGAITASAAATSSGIVASTHAGWWAIVVFALLVVVFGFATSGRWAQASARRLAPALREEMLTPGL